MTARIIHLNWFKLASVLFVLSFFVATSSQTALATAGVNRTINFQGKVVNKTTGLNVADGNYDFTFKLYNVSSAGSPIWTENWTAGGGGQLTVTNGVFRAALGSFTTFASANVDFNNDALYLDITFNGEAMGSRVQLTAVPYALNAEKVAGLTVTNNGGNTLNIAANKTLTVSNTITFGGTDSTSFTLPSSTDTLVGLAASQILTNKTIGSTGLTFSGATTDVTTGTNEAFTIMPNGSGNIGLGTTTTAGLLTLGNSGRTPIGKALAVFDQYETNGDILTGSVSGSTKFVFNNGGNLGIGTALPSRKLQLVISDASTGLFNIQNQYGEVLDITGVGAVTFGNSALNNSGGLYSFGSGGSSSYVTSASSDYFAINPATSNVGRLLNVQQAGTSRFAVLAGGNVGIGTTTINSLLHVRGTTTGNALMTLDQLTATGDLFTASASGTTKFVIGNTGNVGIGTSITSGYNLDVTGTARFTGAITVASCSGCGGVGGTNYWQLNDGALTPFSTSLDLLLGATATSSAKFAFMNVNSGTPTASLSGNLALAAPTGANPATTHSVLNGGTINFQTSVGGDAGLTSRLFIQNDGNIGIGTTTAGSKLTVAFTSAPATDMTSLINTSGGATATGVDGMQIDYATAGTTASADNAGLRVNVTSNNSGTTTTLEGIYIGDLSSAEGNSTETALKIGTGWDTGISVASGGITVSGGGLTLSGASGLAYSGSARPTKTMILSAEYPGAVLTASSSATVNGSMTSDASPSATFGAGTNNWMNYYMWTSTQSSLQDYTVAVRITVPKDFSAWNSTALQINYNTQLTLSASNKLDVLVYRAANASASPLSYSTANVSSTAKTWKTVDISSSDLSTLVAGDTFVVYLKMYAKDSNYVQVGDIVLSYLAAF